MLEMVKPHKGYHGCERCVETVIWQGKMTYPGTDVLRNDLQFDEMNSEGHHIGQSPLTYFGVGMVSQFVLDYMHLVCLGLMKRLLLFWREGPLRCRVGLRVQEQI